MDTIINPYALTDFELAKNTEGEVELLLAPNFGDEKTTQVATKVTLQVLKSLEPEYVFKAFRQWERYCGICRGESFEYRVQDKQILDVYPQYSGEGFNDLSTLNMIFAGADSKLTSSDEFFVMTSANADEMLSLSARIRIETKEPFAVLWADGTLVFYNCEPNQ